MKSHLLRVGKSFRAKFDFDLDVIFKKELGMSERSVGDRRIHFILIKRKIMSAVRKGFHR